MSRSSPEDPPELVTDEPGLDPVSGRPWGEETPGKRVATYSLMAVVCAAAAVYLLVEGPGTGRGQVGLVLAPISTIIFSVLAWRAVKEYRATKAARDS